MISFNLKKVLSKKKITMTEVSEKTGISKNTLSLLGNGTTKGIQFETLNKLLEYLSVGVQELIVFSSKEEVKDLSIFLERISNWKVTQIKGDHVFSPGPNKKDNESQTEYEYRLEKLEKEGTAGQIIGKVVTCEEEALFKVTINLKDFSISFKCLFRWNISGIENFTKVKENYFKSKYATSDLFKREMSLYTSSYIFDKGLKKGINKFLISEYQKEYIVNEIAKKLPSYTPKEILDFFNKLYVSPEHQNKFSVLIGNMS